MAPFGKPSRPSLALTTGVHVGGSCQRFPTVVVVALLAGRQLFVPDLNLASLFQS